LETKYTLAVVLVLLLASFAVWQRKLLVSRGFLLALLVAGLLLLPNLLWEAGHGWVSVHWFLNPPPSATDESRPQYLADLLVFAALFLVVLPIGLPVLPLQTAIKHGIVKARSDYQDELGWPALARNVQRLAGGADVVLASNYGEAGALELFGRDLPPVAAGDV